MEDEFHDDETVGTATCAKCGKEFADNEGAIGADFDFCAEHAERGVMP